MKSILVGAFVMALFTSSSSVSYKQRKKVDKYTFAGQHTKDPTKCKKVCTPNDWDEDTEKLPEEFPDDVEVVECEGTMCARAQPGDMEGQCSEYGGCSVFCSAVCCVCLRGCI